MGVADVAIATDDALLYNADDCDELDVSAFAVDQLLSQDKCLVDQLDCGCGEDDDDQSSLAGTFIGDDDDELLSARTLVDVDVADEDRPSLFKQRTDSVRSSFSMRETSIMSAPPCTCGSSERKRTRLLSASEEYLESHMRFGLSVRVVGIESAEMNSRFILRVEDIETKKHWEVRKNTKEMAQFYNQIRHICMEQAPLKKEMWGTFRGLRKLRLPKKFLHSRGALCYQRRVVYDSLLRHAAALISPAPMGPRRRQVVMLLQQFLNVPQYCESTDREYCNCWFFPTRVNASQLVNEIFSSPSHPIQRQCNIFIADLIKKTHDTRRTRLYPRQAQAILRTITKKMTEVKKAILSDVSLLQQVGTSRHEMGENEFDDFVDEVRRAAAAFAQKAIMVELEDHVHESLHVLFGEEEERFILPKLRELQSKSQSFFGIPDHLQQWNDWEDACAELRRLNEFSLPMDKLKCILRASSAIFHACNASTKQKTVGADQCIVPAVSTDEFLQILFFVVAKSELSRPLLVLQMVRLTCDQDDLTGEMGYYFANFEAAMKLVEDGSFD